VTPSGSDRDPRAAGLRPLTGIVVVDCARMVSGPLAAHFLAGLGAEVLRIEPPGGDATWNTPPFVGPDGVHPGPRARSTSPSDPSAGAGASARSCSNSRIHEAGTSCAASSAAPTSWWRTSAPG